MKAVKEERTEEQCNIIEKGMTAGNSKEACNTHKATKTQQHKSAAIKDHNGNVLSESMAVLNWWTEYCSGLYNYGLHPDTGLLQSNQTPIREAESLPMLRGKVVEAVPSLKAGKSRHSL